MTRGQTLMCSKEKWTPRQLKGFGSRQPRAGEEGAPAALDGGRDQAVDLVAVLLVGGAVSMALGEYVSVSTQRDTERALLAKERRELRDEPEEELAELAFFYEQKGLNPELAQQVAVELTARDALAAHAEVELGIDPDDLTNPWHAAWASMLAFTVGAILPLLTISLAGADTRLAVTVVSVMVALALTGFASARLGQAPPGRAVLRNVAGGLIAMAITYLIGLAVGSRIG